MYKRLISAIINPIIIFKMTTVYSMRNQIFIFLDMDQCVANFLDAYLLLAEKLGTTVKPPYSDNSKNPDLFRISVRDHAIFEDLEFMPKAEQLIKHLQNLELKYNMKIEMLTSVNSQEDVIAEMAANQKNLWLKKMGIHWRPNFVRANHEKAEYAHERAILIDDSLHCIEPFKTKGGLTIHYSEFNEQFIECLDEKIQQILALEAA